MMLQKVSAVKQREPYGSCCRIGFQSGLQDLADGTTKQTLITFTDTLASHQRCRVEFSIIVTII